MSMIEGMAYFDTVSCFHDFQCGNQVFYMVAEHEVLCTEFSDERGAHLWTEEGTKTSNSGWANSGSKKSGVGHPFVQQSYVCWIPTRVYASLWLYLKRDVSPGVRWVNQDVRINPGSSFVSCLPIIPIVKGGNGACLLPTCAGQRGQHWAWDLS